MKALQALALTVLLAGPLQAQGWIEPIREPDFNVVKVRTAVSVSVTGRIALVEVEEWFRNDGSGLGEGDYLYPLPGEAVFSNFSLFQGDQELRGETMDAAQARAIYEEIVRRKRDPALIELAGHGLVRARVFPINAGETRKITLRYTQLLDRAGDALQFRYSAAGRTGAQAGVEGDIQLRRRMVDAPLTFTLVADSGAAFGDPFSPTHSVRVTRDEGRLTVRPDGELSGDFALFLPLARSLVGITVAAHRPAGENGYFMLTLSPGRAEGRVQPRDLTVVLDVSGSMSGSKIDQAKAALRQLLGSLGADDRFRLVAFSNGVRAHQSGWSPARADELADARRWIERLDADGGTNIAGALSEAFRMESPSERLPIVVFLTDGLPSVDERDPERIAQLAERERGRARVFAFGVGYDVNTYLLDRLTAAARGATQYVEPGEDVEQALSVLTAKIQHPVLTDLEIGDAPVELLPDLFVGEELVVFGRYSAARTREGAVSVAGRRSGRSESFSTRAAFPAHELANDYIPRLWASRKLGALSQQLRLEGHDEELVEEIRRTALRYGLLSEYTSYLVQEPEEFANMRGMRQDQPSRQVVGGVRASAAPTSATGEGAVAAAEQDRARREAKSEAEIIAADEELLKRGNMGQTRHVAGRLFADHDGVWTDLAQRQDSLRAVEVAPYSAAYFALLGRLPELEPYCGEFEQVEVRGEQVAIRVVDGGSGSLTERELDRLVREFRGR
jgi:Ca-activated chloride channel family protein